MSGIELYVVIGFAFLVVLIGIGAVFFLRREPEFVARKPAYPLLTLGIIFLIPGLLTLIIDGERTVFLYMGLVFTLSGIIVRFLIKSKNGFNVSRLILISSLIGFTLGSTSGVAVGMIFDLPEILLIILLGAIGLLAGILFGRLIQRQSLV